VGRAVAGVVLGAALAGTSVPALAESFLAPGSPAVLRAVAALEESPEPVLSFEPIYALHAKKTLTVHRFVADTRTLRIVRKPLDDAEFLRLLAASRTVLLEPSLLSTMNPVRWQALTTDFAPVFSEPPHAVLVRRVNRP
jgi:hypothetical protein